MKAFTAVMLSILLTACASPPQKEITNIGGPYYLQSGLTDRKDSDLGLVLVHQSKTRGFRVIDEHIGDSGRFGWHVLGDTVIYARSLPKNPDQLYVYKLYSPKKGYLTLSNRFVHEIQMTESRLILFHTSKANRAPENVTEYAIDDLTRP